MGVRGKRGTYVLVDQQNGNVLALGGEAVKGGLNGAVFRLCVHDEEILLCIWRLRHVLGLSVLRPVSRSTLRGRAGLTPTPASSMPVTVS